MPTNGLALGSSSPGEGEMAEKPMSKLEAARVAEIQARFGLGEVDVNKGISMNSSADDFKRRVANRESASAKDLEELSQRVKAIARADEGLANGKGQWQEPFRHDHGRELFNGCYTVGFATRTCDAGVYTKTSLNAKAEVNLRLALPGLTDSGDPMSSLFKVSPQSAFKDWEVTGSEAVLKLNVDTSSSTSITIESKVERFFSGGVMTSSGIYGAALEGVQGDMFGGSYDYADPLNGSGHGTVIFKPDDKDAGVAICSGADLIAFNVSPDDQVVGWGSVIDLVSKLVQAAVIKVVTTGLPSCSRRLGPRKDPLALEHGKSRALVPVSAPRNYAAIMRLFVYDVGTVEADVFLTGASFVGVAGNSQGVATSKVFNNGYARCSVDCVAPPCTFDCIFMIDALRQDPWVDWRLTPNLGGSTYLVYHYGDQNTAYSGSGYTLFAATNAAYIVSNGVAEVWTDNDLGSVSHTDGH